MFDTLLVRLFGRESYYRIPFWVRRRHARKVQAILAVGSAYPDQLSRVCIAGEQETPHTFGEPVVMEYTYRVTGHAYGQDSGDPFEFEVTLTQEPFSTLCSEIRCELIRRNKSQVGATA